VAGPEAFYIDDLITVVLDFDRDPRKVIADPEAPYFGVRLDESSLMPGPDAQLGGTRLDWWIVNVPPPPSNRVAA
jgi:hypothetical protein